MNSAVSGTFFHSPMSRWEDASVRCVRGTCGGGGSGGIDHVICFMESSCRRRCTRSRFGLSVDKIRGEDKVLSGFRATCNLLIYLDLPKAMEDGILFYRSANDVILTEGVDGVVAPKYFMK